MYTLHNYESREIWHRVRVCIHALLVHLLAADDPAETVADAADVLVEEEADAAGTPAVAADDTADSGVSGTHVQRALWGHLHWHSHLHRLPVWLCMCLWLCVDRGGLVDVAAVARGRHRGAVLARKAAPARLARFTVLGLVPGVVALGAEETSGVHPWDI